MVTSCILTKLSTMRVKWTYRKTIGQDTTKIKEQEGVYQRPISQMICYSKCLELAIKYA